MRWLRPRVWVGREEQRLGLLEGARNGVDVFLVAFDHLVLHGEVVLRVDRAFLRHEVANVAVGGKDFESPAEVFLDGLRLGRDSTITRLLLKVV